MTDNATDSEPTDGEANERDASSGGADGERASARAREPTIQDAEDDQGDAPETPGNEVSGDGPADESSDSEGGGVDDQEDDGDQEDDAAEAAEASEPADGHEGDSDVEEDDDGASPEQTQAEPDANDDGETDEEADDTPERRWRNLHGQGVEWLDELFDRMHLDADADIENREGTPHVDIHGPDAAHLLGRGKLGPKAIEGIETLLQSVFSTDDAAKDVYVDVDDRRADRKAMLQEVAVSMADKAVELDEQLAVSGLNSTERRIIHRKLRDYDGVDTESVGDGIFRRLTIDPT